MSGNRNIISRLAEFFRYIRYELTGKERNLFERELQKDPFADEAMEGFTNISESEAIEDLMRLKEKISKRTTTKSSSFIYRIAGIVVLIIAVTGVLVLTVVKKPNNQVALNSPEPETLEIKKGQPIIEPDSKQNARYEKSKEKKLSFKADESTVAKGIAQKTDSVEPSVNLVKDNVVSESRAIQSKEEVSRELLVSAPKAAMARKKNTASPDSQGDINLKPWDSTLSEVVVTGYSSRKSDIAATDEDVSNHIHPQPLVGKSKFEKYLDKNLHKPDTSDAVKKAVVVLSFMVRTSGQIDSIRIIKSPGKQYSDEAIRVIMTGPEWKSAERNGKLIEEVVRLRVVFR